MTAPRPRRSCSRAAAPPRPRSPGWTSRLAARTTDDEGDYEHRSVKYQKMVRDVLDAQRRAVVELRNSGEISNDVMHRIERELDLEDERLEI